MVTTLYNVDPQLCADRPKIEQMVFGHPAKENAYANKLEAQAKEVIPGKDLLCSFAPASNGSTLKKESQVVVIAFVISCEVSLDSCVILPSPITNPSQWQLLLVQALKNLPATF